MIEIDQNIMASIVKGIMADRNKQVLTIFPNEELRLTITIPHSVYEWFVEVFDIQERKVYSNWLDHYGDTEANLKSEMKESVERFILAVTMHPIRIVNSAKPDRSVLEIFKDEQWTEIIY